MQKSRRFEDLLLLCSLKLTDYSVFSPEVISQGVSVDAAFAMPEVYEFLEAERIKYAIRLPAQPSPAR